MIKSTYWAVFNRLLPILYAFIPLFIIVRKVTPIQLGEFFYYSLILTTFFQVSSFNAKNIFINKFLRFKFVFYHVFFKAFTVFRVVLFFLALLIIFIDKYTYLDKNIIILSLFIYLLSYSYCQEWCLESKYKQSKIFIVRLFSSTIIFFVKLLYVLYFEINLSIVILMSALESFLYYFVIAIISRGEVDLQNKKSRDNVKFKYVFNLIFPFFISLLLVVLYSKVDQVMIRFLSGESELADYVISRKFIEPVFIVSSALSTTALVYLTRNTGMLQSKIASGYFLLFLIVGTILSLFLSAVVPFLIPIAFGEQFSDLSLLVMINSASVLFQFLAIFNGLLLTVYNLNNLIIYRSMFGLILNFILNLILIPKYGAIGASIATLFTLFFGGIVIYFVSAKTKRIAKTISMAFKNPRNLKIVKL